MAKALSEQPMPIVPRLDPDLLYVVGEFTHRYSHPLQVPPL